MTIKEIEAACIASQPLDFSRHSLESSDLPLSKSIFPLGFPMEVRTNAPEVLDLMDDLWGKFEKQHPTGPVRIDVHVVESTSTECPPTPVYRIPLPLLTAIADGENYAIVNLKDPGLVISMSRAALLHPLYAKHAFLALAACIITTHYTTPLHAGCVSFNGRGVLLCGDSGAGKSTLSYACARAGWTFTTDDASYLLNGGPGFTVSGDCHKVRLRPEAANLFPEIKGLDLTPRFMGKDSIELPTAPQPSLACKQNAPVDFIVFLNRNHQGPPELVPYRKDVVRHSMMQTIYGLPETRAVQHAAIDRLLSLPVFELRYTALDWAIERLQKLVQEGR